MRGVAVGAALTVTGAVLWFVFADVETPIIGLRQAGVVLVVLGVIDMAVAILRRRRHPRRGARPDRSDPLGL